MKQKFLLSSTLMQLEVAYEKNFPHLKHLASATDAAAFKAAFAHWIVTFEPGEARYFFEQLVAYEGETIQEWSHNQPMTMQTLTLLYHFLKHEADPAMGTDLYIDLFHQLQRLHGKAPVVPSVKKIRHQIDRWPSG